MVCRWIRHVVLGVGAAVGLYGAEVKLNDARTTLEKWVETRQLIAKTKADWQADKEMLAQTAELFEREIKSIEEQRSKLSTDTSQVDKERAETEASLKGARESLESVQQFAVQFEGQLTQLATRLPAPLQESLKPLLNRLPSDPANTRMTAAERLQVIIGILNEIDKFNYAVNIFNERRTNGKGEEVAVDTVYVGLGAGYFVNSTGDLAGVGAPGAKGWEWTLQPELAASVQEVIRIYRNERSARFVPLPVTIR